MSKRQPRTATTHICKFKLTSEADVVNDSDKLAKAPCANTRDDTDQERLNVVSRQTFKTIVAQSAMLCSVN